MTFNRNQVAEIVIPASAEGEKDGSEGTGYLLFPHCLLTAFHVVQGCDGKTIWVRLLGNYGDTPDAWSPAELVWSNQQFDLAILHYSDNFPGDVTPPRIKRINLNLNQDKIHCRAYGFPRFNVLPDDVDHADVLDGENPDVAIDLELLEGWIKASESKLPGRLLIENEGSSPRSMDEWKGMSGAPVFAGDYLVGVVRRGLDPLKGHRLEAIALAYALDADSTLNQCLRENPFNQELLALDVDGIEASKLYDLEQELEALKLRQDLITVETSERQTESAHINMAIKRLKKELAGYGSNNQSAIRMAEVPKQRLADFLVNLSALSEDYQAIFWTIWSSNVGFSKSTAQSIDVKQAFTLLIGAQDSECLSRFLSDLYVQLGQSGLGTRLEELVELSTCCGVDLSQVTVACSAPTATTVTQLSSNESAEGSLLIKIEGGNTPMSYQIKVWLVSDCQVYQDRIRRLSDSASQPISQDNAATPLVNGQEIQVQSEQTQAEEIKQALAKLFESIWKKQGLRHLKPHVTFFVPVQLMAIDFHNIQWGVRGDTLGRKVPVSVSCLGRFDESEEVNELISEYREDWVDRWQKFEDFGDRSLLEHLECDEDNPDVDMTCPQTFQCWLEEKDDEREWLVSGLGLYSPRDDWAKAFISFLLGGLPFVFWPNRTLAPGEIEELQQRMDVVPAKLLTEFKSCRLKLGRPTKDAGPMSILLDNPYLCPPDCEYDY